MEGTPFGRYRLIAQLGHGGMGEVWHAYDATLDRTVAIKMLLPHFAKDEKFEQRFRREARAAARLDNPHVVPIYDVGEIEGRLYVAMRMINGVDLQTAARRRAAATPTHRGDHRADRQGAARRAQSWADPSRHQAVQHFGRREDFAYLIDFGIARAAGETGLTSTGATIGTWSYMAPERFSTGHAEASSDIYALACVLYQCLTGELPFPAVALEQIAMAHMITPPPQPSTGRSTVPAAMDAVIATGLAKDPAQRYPSGKDLAAAARAAITTVPDRTGPSPARPGTPVRPRPVPRPPVATPSRSTPPPPPQPTITTAATVAASLPPMRPERRQRVAAPTPGGPNARRAMVVAAGVVVAVALVAGISVLVLKSPSHSARTSQSAPSPTSAPPAPTSSLLSAPPMPWRPKYEVLTLNITMPYGIAVDGTGTLYVSSVGNWQAYKLPAGSNTPVLLPISGLNYPYGIAVDHAGNVYVTDSRHGRVLKLAAGSNTPTALPFGASHPIGVAVDNAGAVYITDNGSSDSDSKIGVFKLAPGSNTAVRLPFDVRKPDGVAVDNAGNVYVGTYDSKVLKLSAGADAAVSLDFFGRNIAVDNQGNLYVATSNSSSVMKYPPGSNIPVLLQFPDLYDLSGMAVDDAGNLYITTNHSNQVVKVPAP